MSCYPSGTCFYHQGEYEIRPNGDVRLLDARLATTNELPDVDHCHRREQGSEAAWLALVVAVLALALGVLNSICGGGKR